MQPSLFATSNLPYIIPALVVAITFVIIYLKKEAVKQ